MREYDVQKLCTRRKEHLLLNMFAQKSNPAYVDTNRPDMLLRNHNGTNILIFLIVFAYFVHRFSWKNLYENLTVCKKET